MVAEDVVIISPTVMPKGGDIKLLIEKLENPKLLC